MIKLVAHRGYQRKYPENTLLGFSEAIKAGACHVETDVQLSADAIPVLYHDDSMRRISEVEGAVHDYPFSALVNLPASEPHRFADQFESIHITPLADLVTLLAANPYVHAFIEIKCLAVEQHGIETVYRSITEVLQPALDQCTLISYSIPFMDYARKAGWPSIGAVLYTWDQRNSVEISLLRPDYLFCGVETLPQAESLNLENAQSVIFEVDNPEVARELVARGIDLIETFDVGGMQAALSSDP